MSREDFEVLKEFKQKTRKGIEHEGTEEGETCNRNGCKGVIVHERELDGCSCHINPPCSYCTDDNAECPLCGWVNKREEESTTSTPLFEIKKPEIVEDDGNTYKVERYFDSVYEGCEGVNLKYGDASRLLQKLNRKDRYYVSYRMSKENV